MKKTKLATWILIADGSRATLYEQSDSDATLRQLENWDNEGGRTSDHVAETDALGTSGGGSQPNAMGSQSDPKRHSQYDFARKLAHVLNEQEKAYDHLIVVAPPKVLGDLRKQLSPHVQPKIIGEFHKDLTHVSAHDLPGHLTGLLAPK
jgi:protein required for attachment to host cells